jgi:hypothetical protein
MVTKVYRQCDTALTIGVARRVVVKGPSPSDHHAHQSEVHIYMQMYRRARVSPATPSCGIGAGGAFDSPSGCSSTWEVQAPAEVQEHRLVR